eukprot:8160358-Pyramimonas_sp.AAC.1
MMMLSAVALTPSRGPPHPPGLLFGAVVSGLGRAHGVPLCIAFLFPLPFSTPLGALFARFRALLGGPLGVSLGSSPRLLGPSE